MRLLYVPNRRVRSNISYKLLKRRVLLVPTAENGFGVCHHTDSDAFYAVGGGNTDLASSVTTNFIPYYLNKKYTDVKILPYSVNDMTKVIVFLMIEWMLRRV